MKLAAAIALLTLCTLARAVTVHVEWDASPPGTGYTVAGYTLYNADTNAPVATTSTATLRAVVECGPGTHRFYVAAFSREYVYSAASNILTFSVPPPPSAPRIPLAVETSMDLQRWETVWTSAADRSRRQFFRLTVSNPTTP